MQELPHEPAGQTNRQTGQGQGISVVYPRGPIAGLPEAHASRRERFAELDDLQPGWQVELRSRGAGGAVDAVFYSPTGEAIAIYAVFMLPGVMQECSTNDLACDRPVWLELYMTMEALF